MCHVGGWNWANDSGALNAVPVLRSNCGVRCPYQGCESFREAYS